jgi:methionine-rich copper-binding protein CopC
MSTRHLRAASAAAVCAALILPATSLGHAEIRSYSPKPGSTVARDLEFARVTFEERVLGGRIAVRNARGKQVSHGTGSLVHDGTQLRARLVGGLGPGRYAGSVRWVSDDGHVQTKTWSFRLR